MQVYFETLQVQRTQVLVWLMHPHRMLVCTLDYLRQRQQEALDTKDGNEQKNFILYPHGFEEYKMLQSPMDSKMPILIKCHENELLCIPTSTNNATRLEDCFVLSHDEMHRILQTTRSVMSL